MAEKEGMAMTDKPTFKELLEELLLMKTNSPTLKPLIDIIAALERAVELEAASRRLLDHLQMMQGRMRNHIEPFGLYPSKDDFINKIIEDLDGPKQREAQAALCQALEGGSQ